jgi:uroporphyrin-III C-methyltransferase
LAQLAATAEGLKGPALLIVGEAMALALSSAHPGEGRDPAAAPESCVRLLDPGLRREIGVK